MKTIEQWLNELESPYREQALENMDSQMRESKVADIKEALLGAFEWFYTGQGDKYWRNFYNSF